MSEAKFVLSRSRLLEQYSLLSDIGRVSYSVKTNPIAAAILESATDCMFSIHTKEELSFVNDKSRIWFLAESWTKDELESLYNQGIRSFVVYNINDLKILEKFLPSVSDKINLLLRVKLREHSIFTEKYFVFGFDSLVVNELISQLRSNPKIGKLGIHFHRKTQNLGEWSLKYELSNALSESTLEAIDFINIGGGLPIRYKNSNDSVVGTIFGKISELKYWLASYNIDLILEPGRFLSGPATKLVTQIINIDGRNITVNASVYNSAMDTLIVPHRLIIDGEFNSAVNGVKEYTIKGCTPCSLDLFRYSVFLKEKKIGDEVTFLNAGAYNFYTDFCNLSKIKTEIVD